MCRFAGRGYSHGVFVGTEHGPIELTAYAEVVTIQRILCTLPNWQPGAIMIASQETRKRSGESSDLPSGWNDADSWRLGD